MLTSAVLGLYKPVKSKLRCETNRCSYFVVDILAIESKFVKHTDLKQQNIDDTHLTKTQNANSKEQTLTLKQKMMKTKGGAQ